MRSSDRRRGVASAALATLAALALGCSDGFEPLSSVPAPTEIEVEVARLNTIRLTWKPVEDGDVIGYAIERRANLQGPFAPLVAQVPQRTLEWITWIDTDVDPETFYGYRVYTVTRFGDRSPPSVVGGTRTPPLPGIEVTTTALVTDADALDPDGYDVVITGPQEVRAAIAPFAQRRFSPLPLGRYDVALNGVIGRCSVDGPASQAVDVIDSTAQTLALVAFKVTCKDPKRGEIRVTVTTTGNPQDGSHDVDLFGEADDPTLPDSERIVSRLQSIGSASGTTLFANLRPGTYDITLEGLAANCQLQGSATRTVSVTALGVANVAYAVHCASTEGTIRGCATCPLVLRNTWSSPTAPANGKVTLALDFDQTAISTQSSQGVRADIYYDPAILRADAVKPGQLPAMTSNLTVPGRVSFLAASSAPRGGIVRAAEIEFTVIGTEGASMVTRTENFQGGTTASPVYQTQVRIEEGEFTVGPGGTVNQAPTAEANGPYSGTVGVSLSFSAAGSADPDGTISTYSWSFGDNSTGTGATTTHSYAAAGTYTATLTVTDDDGATDTDQTTVSITGIAPPPNQAPIANANGPYSATAGVPITLSASGSSDPDGSIASYQWALGNGQTATGVSPSVTYAAAGTYAIALTVTDDRGGTATAQTSVTVAPPATTKPLSWKATFGPVDVVNDLVAVSITLDLRTDLPETPGVETLQSFALDSLKWDPTLLQFYAINLGPNVVGTSNQTKVNAGNLAFQGTVSGAQAQGLITIATVRFRLVGAAGARATTTTHLGPLLGAPSTGSYAYNSKTAIIEGEIILP